MSLLILRCVFLVVAGGLGAYLTEKLPQYNSMAVFSSVLLVAAGVLAIDLAIRRKQLDAMSAIYFGTVVGVFLSYVLLLAVDPLLPTDHDARQAVQLVVAMVLVYVCISLILQTRNDFRFIIPYVEFAKEVKGLKPYVLDTSVIIDGRIADVVETGVFDFRLLAPQFVLTELQSIADSSDALRRKRGRRGLDILNRLRTNNSVELHVYDRELPEFKGQPVDIKLVLLAKHLDGKIVTGDYNLNKVAKLHGVPVINLNDLANALKPTYLPGEELSITVHKPGEQAGQGVGYLDDGTMVVIEGARNHINDTVLATVTNTSQTSSGRMIFARFERLEPQTQQAS